MNRSDLATELSKAFVEQPWHGPSLVRVLEEVPFECVNRRAGSAHSIAEIVYHLTGWTEECVSRLQNNQPRQPARGDWPTDFGPDMDSWKQLLNELFSAHKMFAGLVSDLSDAELQEKIGTVDDPEMATGVTKAQTISGIVQHYAYHAGQIILLVRLFDKE
ncbi:MAG: DinB family protein [Mucilaginibacter polytrichastri]|nr:DinB family protein [Mucilaginibacter polytrichastri]